MSYLIRYKIICKISYSKKRANYLAQGGIIGSGLMLLKILMFSVRSNKLKNKYKTGKINLGDNNHDSLVNFLILLIL